MGGGSLHTNDLEVDRLPLLAEQAALLREQLEEALQPGLPIGSWAQLTLCFKTTQKRCQLKVGESAVCKNPGFWLPLKELKVVSTMAPFSHLVTEQLEPRPPESGAKKAGNFHRFLQPYLPICGTAAGRR